MLRELRRELRSASDPERAKTHAWFFKTGKGEYGEGDRFLGIRVPIARKIALRYRDLSLPDVARLLASRIHEERFAALEILVAQYARAEAGDRERIVEFYLKHPEGINNWDLVDTSAPYILGDYLKDRPRDILDRLAGSSNLWERRIAIVSTLALIRAGDLAPTFRISEKLLADKHDLIHKAVGWMLREAGKVSRPALLRFLRKHCAAMPRTALRYSIERFPMHERKEILAGKIPAA